MIEGVSSIELFVYLIKATFTKQEPLLDYFKRLTKKYDTILSTWINFKLIVTVRSPELAKEVLTDTKTYTKSQSLTTPIIQKFLGENHLVNVVGDHWKKQRKIIDPSFQNLNLYCQIFQEKTKLILEKIENEQTVNDIHDFTQKLALDVKIQIFF
jgi:cytochrome P450